MLSIIPKEVLATLGNIHKLLDIGQNFTKTNKNNVMNGPPNPNAPSDKGEKDANKDK
jgi:hypothetical protein